MVIAALLSGLLAQGLHLLGVRAYDGLAPVCRVETPEPLIGLSFDDGPSAAFTRRVVQLLRTYDDRATFFLIGKNARDFPRLVSLELSAGMEVGNHTWSHPHLPAIDASELEAQVRQTQELLGREPGAAPRLFRAPYGEIDPDELRSVEAEGLLPIHWSVALDHYVFGLGMDPPEAARAILNDLAPGDILLAHDANDGGIKRDEAVSTLELLLPALQEAGYELVSVGQLLQSGHPVRAVPRPWFWQQGFSCS